MIETGGKKIIIKLGDITKEAADAIVNDANQYLRHRSGVAGVIVRRGGYAIQQESNSIIRKIGNVPTGQAVITGAGSLKCRYVIHAVGPRRGEEDEDSKLKNTVWNVLLLAEEYMLGSIAMPPISSGISGVTKDRCAEILIETSIEFLKQKAVSLNTIIMCSNNEDTYNIFLSKESQSIAV